MQIITNADDFGQNEELVRATIECFENGSLTSATIMVNMAGTGPAIEYARRNPQFSYGVHLTYVLGDNTERPLTDPGLLPTLVGDDGRFRESNVIRLKALRRGIPVAEIARETEAQLAFLRDHSVPISHVDSHGHLHRFAPFRQALAQVLPRFGITKVRSSQDVYLHPNLKSPNYWLGFVWRRAIMKRFRTTEHFYMPTSTWDTNWVEPLLARVRGGSIEVGVHPGYSEAWRSAEREILPVLAAKARAGGHTLIGWKDL